MESARSSLWSRKLSRLNEITDVLAVRPAWLRLFSTNDAFVWPFNEAIEIGRVFYPVDGCHLTRRQYSALLSAIRSVGETCFFLSIIESEGLSFLDRDWGHWSCALPSYEEYCALHITAENAMYSKEGRWGLVISHEMHALVGGSETFVAALDKHYRGWGEDLCQLREAWSGNENAGWLEPMIKRAMP